jgi:molybdopterin-guanine dinucleotide biosynthesis protein B
MKPGFERARGSPVWESPNKGKRPPLLSIVGFSGSGKTTLIEKLIAELKRRGYTVGTIKHDAHGFDIDHPGKDSWRHKKAGASTTIISSSYQIGMVRDVDHDHGPDELLPLLSDMDIVLAEGFKSGRQPKIEIFRPKVQKKPACKGDTNLIAVVTDRASNWGVPQFGTDEISSIADFIVQTFNLENGAQDLTSTLYHVKTCHNTSMRYG